MLQDLQLQGGLAALALAGLPEFQQLVKSPQEKSSLTVVAEWRKVGPIYSFAASFIRDQFPMDPKAYFFQTFTQCVPTF